MATTEKLSSEPTISDLGTLLTVVSAAGQVGVTPLLLGEPGVGKSAVIEDQARAEDLPCEVVYGTRSEATDFGGMPVVPEGAREHLLSPPPWARRLREAGAGWLFLEELTSVEEPTQKAMLGTIFGRRVGELQLPAGVRVVAAANPPESAVGGGELAPPVANRLLHVTYAPTAESWFEGITSGFSTPPAGRVLPRDKARQAREAGAVVSFLRHRDGSYLHQRPKDAALAGGPWPSRRTWDMAISMLSVLPDEAVTARQAAVAGLVGSGIEGEFSTWRDNADLPDPAAVVADPTSVAWRELDPSRVFAVISAVVSYGAMLGTKDGWRAAWEPLGVAADQGRADVAGWGAYRLADSRPANVVPPKGPAAKFDDVLARINRDRKAEAAAKAAATETSNGEEAA